MLQYRYAHHNGYTYQLLTRSTLSSIKAWIQSILRHQYWPFFSLLLFSTSCLFLAFILLYPEYVRFWTLSTYSLLTHYESTTQQQITASSSQYQWSRLFANSFLSTDLDDNLVDASLLPQFQQCCWSFERAYRYYQDRYSNAFMNTKISSALSSSESMNIFPSPFIDHEDTFYVVISCTQDSIGSPSGACAVRHSFSFYLLLLSHVLPTHTQYLSSMIVSDASDIDEWLGWNDGELYEIDLIMHYNNIRSHTIERDPFLQVFERIERDMNTSALMRSRLPNNANTASKHQQNPAYTPTIYTLRELKFNDDDLQHLDPQALRIISNIMTVKYCLARIYRPAITDLYAPERIAMIQAYDAHHISPFHGALEAGNYKLMMAVQLTVNADEKVTETLQQVIERTLARIQQVLQWKQIYLNTPNIPHISIHLFVDSNTIQKLAIISKELINDVINRSSLSGAAVHLHLNISTAVALHHFIAADLFIGASDDYSMMAAFSRANRFSFLPLKMPLRSIISFQNETLNMMHNTTSCAECTSLNWWLPNLFVSHSACQNLAYELSLNSTSSTTR